MTRGFVNVAIASADGPVERCKITRDRTVFPVRRDVVARAQMRQFDTDSADLHSEHTLVQIGTAVRSAYGILIAGASMLALASGRS